MKRQIEAVIVICEFERFDEYLKDVKQTDLTMLPKICKRK